MMYGYTHYNPRPLSEKEQRYRANMLKREQGRREAQQRRFQDWMSHGDNEAFYAQLQAAARTERNYGFMSKMVEAISQYGSLTEKQEAAARNVLAKRAEQAEQRRADNAKLAARSNYVGSVGDRREFVLSIDRTFELQGQMGPYSGHIMHDRDGNVFVYFGAKQGDAGQALRGKATIKRHDERDGVKQTVLSRPKFDLIDYGANDDNDFDADIQAADAHDLR